MKNLLSLLERFSKVLNRSVRTQELIAQTIQTRTRVILPFDKISLKDGVLTISASPAAKNEIRLKEEAIRDELKESYQIFVSRIIYK